MSFLSQDLRFLLKKEKITSFIFLTQDKNDSFVKEINDDPVFDCTEVGDPRSAAYFACGVVNYTKRPAVMFLEGATSLMNAIPGLTEAYYSKLPVLVVCHQFVGKNSCYRLVNYFKNFEGLASDVFFDKFTVCGFHQSAENINLQLNIAINSLTFAFDSGPVLLNLFDDGEMDGNISLNKEDMHRLDESAVEAFLPSYSHQAKTKDGFSNLLNEGNKPDPETEKSNIVVFGRRFFDDVPKKTEQSFRVIIDSTEELGFGVLAMALGAAYSFQSSQVFALCRRDELMFSLNNFGLRDFPDNLSIVCVDENLNGLERFVECFKFHLIKSTEGSFPFLVPGKDFLLIKRS